MNKYVKSASLANYLLIAFSVSLAITFFASSYSTVKVANTLSYHSNDGWCDPAVEGFGDHCFGDFAAPLRFANTESPWAGPINNYPPAAFVLMKPFAAIHDIWPGRVALIIFLLIAVASLLFPVLHMYTKKLAPTSIISVALLITLTSGPSVTLIDRGNVLVFTIPAIYMYFFKIGQRDFESAVYYGVFFSIIKPQLFVLVLLLVGMKKYKLIIKWIVMSTILTLASFLLYPSSLIYNVGKWLVSTIKYQNYSAIAVLEPVNVSLKSSIDILAKIFGQSISSSITQPIIYILLGISIFSFLQNFSKRGLEINFFLVSLIPILFVGTTFHYYLVMLLPPLFMMLVSKSENYYSRDLLGKKKSLLLEKIITWLYVIILIPVTIPWSTTGQFQDKDWNNISMHWLLAQASISIFGLYLLLMNIKLRKKFKVDFITPRKA